MSLTASQAQAGRLAARAARGFAAARPIAGSTAVLPFDGERVRRPQSPLSAIRAAFSAARAARPRPAAPADAVSPKIRVTPVSETLPGVFFIQFERGVKLELVLHVMRDRHGITQFRLHDDEDGYVVRVDMDDSVAAAAVTLIAEETSVASVSVNRTVYKALRTPRP